MQLFLPVVTFNCHTKIYYTAFLQAGYCDNEHLDGLLTDVKYRPLVYLTNGPARYEASIFKICSEGCFSYLQCRYKKPN